MNQKLSTSDELHQRLHAQKQKFLRNMLPSSTERREKLNRLKSMLLENSSAIIAAIKSDFGHRSVHETQLLELFPSIEAINFAKKNLHKWIKPRRKAASFWFFPASTILMKQPVGVVGIIVPWNYPLFLAISPLVSALAAGNNVMLKMSEYTPEFSALFAQLIEKTFPENEVTVINGDAEIAQTFSGLAFDHLFFTGSTEVGRLVMKAASENLTPVTLELGGKSPTIITDDYAIDNACQSIVWGKLCNAGQTCIAPDYVYVPEDKLAKFMESAQMWIKQYYPNWVGMDYSSIISDAQLERLQALLKDASDKGARVSLCYPDDELVKDGKMQPVLLSHVSADMRIMQEEIFGPLLPIKTYQSIAEVISEINTGARPLALYLFSHSKVMTNHILSNTISGGVSVNETIAHVAQEHLPFGGVGASGMGHCHGEYGFNTFSKLKPIFKQTRFNASFLVKPPYGKAVERLIKLMVR